MPNLTKGKRFISRFSNQTLQVQDVVDPTPGMNQDTVVVLTDTVTKQVFPVELRVLNKCYKALPDEVSDPKDTSPAGESDPVGEDNTEPGLAPEDNTNEPPVE